MLTILLNLFFAWLLTFVGLDNVFANLLEFSTTQYYLTWFVMGIVQSIAYEIKRAPIQK